MNNKGFTLIEILTTLVIISLILLIAVPSVASLLNQGKEKSYEILKNNLPTAAENYITECIGDNTVVCSNIDINQIYESTGLTITAGELLNNGFLNVSTDLIENSNSGKKIYNPVTQKDVSNCLKVTIKSDNNYGYIYNVDDTEC